MFVINFWCNSRLERGISVHILFSYPFKEYSFRMRNRLVRSEKRIAELLEEFF